MSVNCFLVMAFGFAGAGSFLLALVQNSAIMPTAIQELRYPRTTLLFFFLAVGFGVLYSASAHICPTADAYSSITLLFMLEGIVSTSWVSGCMFDTLYPADSV